MQYPETQPPASFSIEFQDILKRFLNVEALLYALALALAVFLRLFRLGVAPLNDFEAGWALQALDIARHSGPAQVAIGSQPAYVIFTALLLFVFKNANGLARLLPALSGCLLVCLPLALRPILLENPTLRRAGLFLAFGLALDPALVSISRTAGSAMLALSFGLLSLALACRSWYLRHPGLGWALALGALALLSGPALLNGLLPLALALAAARLLFKIDLPEAILPGADLHAGRKSDWLLAGALFLAIATGFLMLPQGLAGFARTLPDYLTTWLQPSGIPALRLPAALLLYQPAALLFGLVGALRAWLDESGGYTPAEAALGKVLSLWAGLALALLLLQPGRQVPDLAWALAPLWGLACLELAHYVLSPANAPLRRIALLAAAVIGFFIVMGLYYGTYLSSLNVTLQQSALLLGGIASMTLIVIFLVGAGWNFEIARRSLAWSLGVVLTVWMLSSTWSMAIIQPNQPAELWSYTPGIGQSRQLLATLQQLSTMKTGSRTSLDVIYTYPSPALRWALRAFPNASFQNEIGQDQLPAAIITNIDDKNPALLAAYRGEAFDWELSAGWADALPPNMSRWLYKHTAPAISQKVILWVRGDVFPGGSLKQPAAQPAAQPAVNP